MVLLSWLAGCACNESPPPSQDELPPTGATATAFLPFSPPPATLYRVSDAEWRNSAEDLFGVRFEGTLPVDYLLYNYTRVGASELTIPPLDLEQYEAAAWQVATLAVPNLGSGSALLGCDAEERTCIRSWFATTGQRAWRRPPDAIELDEVMARWDSILAQGGPVVALRATVASMVLAPDFLFRVEVGEPDPDHPDWRRFTSWEMAGRLASFLTATVPDEELVRAALADELHAPAALLAQAERLLETPRAREAMTAFFAETLELHELQTVSKPGLTDALRTEMRRELELLFQDIALERDADMGELLTSSKSFVGPRLAEIYGVPAGAGLTELNLPLSQERGGILGRAGFLTIQSHVTVTSPTLRGKFVRTRLLCQDIPPPPPGVVTELEPTRDGTLRQQLEEHAINPNCSSCHLAIDPPGFALEHFDPLGRRRELDNGLPIDATGEIDGVPFDGAQQLGEVLVDNPKFNQCLTLELYRFANAQLERREDLGLVAEIASLSEEEGRSFRALVYHLVLSDAFRKLTGPRGETCAQEGETRRCSTPCGTGTEVCASGRWQGCTAPTPGLERCNGQDDDCDGQVDDAVERACAASEGPGTQVCEDGQWLECQGAVVLPGVETCNGADDDQDGQVDEGLEVDVATLTVDQLVAAHYACDPWLDAFSPACHAAASRGCEALGCAVTGLGPLTVSGGSVELACLDETQAVRLDTTFTELSAHHGGCNLEQRQGADCNAAISRYCAAAGLGTGFGPIENSEDNATIVCTPLASVYESSYTALSAIDAGCNASTRVGASCNRAIHEWCRAQGHVSGHGPLENYGDLAVVACLGVQ